MTNTPHNHLETFLAYSLALEEESAERLREAADMMSAHQQHDLAGLFSQLAGYSDKHGDEVKALCKGKTLPKIHPWDFDWPDKEPPETWDYAAIHYDMTPQQVLTNMLLVESNTAAFYQGIAEDSQNEEIVLLAQEFANEERSHVSAVENWLKRLPKEKTGPIDMDPPVEPG